MDKSEREIYQEYRTIKEKEIYHACPKCLVRFKEFVKAKIIFRWTGNREIYYEYRTIKEKEICQACPICLFLNVLKKEEVKKNIKYQYQYLNKIYHLKYILLKKLKYN